MEDYNLKHIFVSILITTILVFTIGGLAFTYKSIYKKADVNLDREIYETSTSYVKGMADDLAKYQYELKMEKDETARKAIIDMIIDKYADFDESQLKNKDLRKFLNDVRNGRVD